ASPRPATPRPSRRPHPSPRPSPSSQPPASPSPRRRPRPSPPPHASPHPANAPRTDPKQHPNNARTAPNKHPNKSPFQEPRREVQAHHLGRRGGKGQGGLAPANVSSPRHARRACLLDQWPERNREDHACQVDRPRSGRPLRDCRTRRGRAHGGGTASAG